MDFPTPKFTTTTETQQWLEILAEIYTYLCTTDETIRSALINTGPHPFTLQCRSPWGYVLNDPDTSPRTDLISDVLIGVRVAAMSDRLAESRWLRTKGEATHDTRAADWLGRSGASVKTRRFQCGIHSLSLWKRPLQIIRSFIVFRSVSGRGFFNI